MPIRFRCVYCNQKMGIARRKAGSVVDCPKCKGQLVVPQPAEDEDSPDGEPEPAGAAVGAADAAGAGDITHSPEVPARAPAKPDSLAPKPAGPSLFERGDIDEMLARDARPAPPGPAAPVPAPAAPKPVNPIDRVAKEEAARRVAPPVPAVAGTPSPGLTLTPTTATVLSVGVVLALAFSFAAGLVVGLMMRNPG